MHFLENLHHRHTSKRKESVRVFSLNVCHSTVAAATKPPIQIMIGWATPVSHTPMIQQPPLCRPRSQEGLVILLAVGVVVVVLPVVVVVVVAVGLRGVVLVVLVLVVVVVAVVVVVVVAVGLRGPRWAKMGQEGPRRAEVGPR